MDSHGLVLIALVIGCLFFWAIWGIFDKKALLKLTPAKALILTYFWYLPLTVIAWPASLILKPAFSSQMFLFTAVGSFSSGLSILAYLHALSIAEASYVLGITAGYPIFMQFLAVWMLHEQLVPARIVGSIFITIGIFLIGFSRPGAHENKGRKHYTALAICLLVAMFGWGLTAVLDKLAIDVSDATATYIGRTIFNGAFFLATAVVWMGCGNRLNREIISNWRYPALSAFCLVAGLVCYMGALAMATASYVVVITSCYPLLTYLFAVFLLGEKWNKVRFAGVVILVLGGIITETTSRQ